MLEGHGVGSTVPATSSIGSWPRSALSPAFYPRRGGDQTGPPSWACSACWRSGWLSVSPAARSAFQHQRETNSRDQGVPSPTAHDEARFPCRQVDPEPARRYEVGHVFCVRFRRRRYCGVQQPDRDEFDRLPRHLGRFRTSEICLERGTPWARDLCMISDRWTVSNTTR
jgi:hypothetical protein